MNQFKNQFIIPAICLGLIAVFALVGDTQEGPQVGYDDTPFIPDQEWRVHDKARPRPQVVQAGLAGAPPSDAVVLFGGSTLDAWHKGDGQPAHWKIEEGAMVATSGGSLMTRESFGDVQLHLEWASPAEVSGDSQGRGNSGVILMGRYEIQVLDSYGNASYADGQAAAMYGQFPPLVNACRPPGEWQTYDILFTAARFEGDELLSPSVVTVLHNGVVVHNARAFIGAVAHRSVGKYSPHPPEAPITLQDHGNPVRYRNIWARRL